jgi:hypothetical protein
MDFIVTCMECDYRRDSNLYLDPLNPYRMQLQVTTVLLLFTLSSSL